MWWARLLALLVLALAIYLTNGPIRPHIVTFSFQVSFMAVGVLGVSLFIILPLWIYDVLMIYMALMAIVFYTLIVPLNGVHTTLPDLLIHGVLPLIFFLVWLKDTLKRETFRDRLWIYFYPLCYLLFALWISKRRGYMIYPFFHPVPMIVITCLIEVITWALHFIKQSL